ncbi:MAG: response regulator [Bacteroidia bacterium]|nr:response regulator [Bacteroidia bacterium]MDW8158007.1 response regulator [Bacteroidia bacterium]
MRKRRKDKVAKYKILVIEDENALLLGIKDFLEEEGYQILTAENGRRGYELAIEEHPDLIICDVMIPEMNGYEVLKCIRRNPKTATTPFIFLTAKSTISDMRKGMELGADDYLTKPFSIEALLKTVQTKFEKYDQIRSQLLLAQQKEITRAIVEAQEAERQNIASDIHDGLGQILTAALMSIQSIKNVEIIQNTPLLKEFLQKLESLLNDAYEEARNIMYNLSPTILSQQGLCAAIENLCWNASACTETEIEFYCNLLSKRYDPITEITIYRIVQEALNNIIKYAQAQTAIVTLDATSTSLHLEIKDNGIGFNYEDIQKVRKDKGGRGIKNIENRVRLLGGELQISTGIGKGTHYIIHIPLSSTPA